MISERTQNNKDDAPARSWQINGRLNKRLCWAPIREELIRRARNMKELQSIDFVEIDMENKRSRIKSGCTLEIAFLLDVIKPI